MLPEKIGAFDGLIVSFPLVPFRASNQPEEGTNFCSKSLWAHGVTSWTGAGYLGGPDSRGRHEDGPTADEHASTRGRERLRLIARTPAEGRKEEFDREAERRYKQTEMRLRMAVFSRAIPSHQIKKRRWYSASGSSTMCSRPDLAVMSRVRQNRENLL